MGASLGVQQDGGGDMVVPSLSDMLSPLQGLLGPSMGGLLCVEPRLEAL